MHFLSRGDCRRRNTQTDRSNPIMPRPEEEEAEEEVVEEVAINLLNHRDVDRRY